MNKSFVDSAGNPLAVGDHVMIYFGNNKLQPGVINKIKEMSAKVLVDAWPSHPNPEVRYSLSKWKRGECMIKVPGPDRPYQPEVYGLLDEIRRLRDESPYMETKNHVPRPDLFLGKEPTYAIGNLVIKTHYILQKNGKYRLVYSFLFFFWSPTFGDGCGNDTGRPVEYPTIDEVKQWRERNDDR